MYFSGFGCMTGIGLTANMTMSAIRAGISGYEVSDYCCEDGKFAIIANVPDTLFMSFFVDAELDENLTDKIDRSAKMMLYALNDLQEQCDLDAKVPLIWLQEEPHPSRAPLSLNSVKDYLNFFEAPVATTSVYANSMGRAGGIAALDRAYKLLHQVGHDYVLIGGAESPYHNEWLAQLDARNRLKTESSLDAFVPGEGAAFLLLSRTPELARRENNNAVCLCPPGVTQSPAHWYNQAPNTGEALHQAMAKALHYSAEFSQRQTGQQQTGQAQGKVDLIVSSMNGENFWGKEYGIAVSRLSGALSQDYRHHHPFEYTGDLGCIGSLFLLAYGAEQIFSQQSQHVICYGSSDDSWRSAACLARVTCAA